MKEKLKRPATILTACLPAIIFITWLNAYYWLLDNGRYKAFIQPKLWPLLVIAIILLLAFSAAFISQFPLRSKASFQFEPWVKAAILFVPVVFLWTIYGQSLGTDAFAKRLLQSGQSVPLTTANFEKKASRALAGNATTILDLVLYAENFNGKPVALEGMVFRGATMGKNSFMLFRFFVACCAADALPFSIRVATANEADIKNDTWVRVEGLFKTETIHDKQVSSILAASVLPIDTPPPEKRYLFF
jgi:putative membrane protein